MNYNLTLGSLFDGSGGFPLGGLMCGIRPIWASEIEPFPIIVTTKRIPFMKHYGDINQINGADIEPVDIITFGSPCTDMSVAGKRAGLDGKQSTLFYQAIRIIKEMREKTNGKYPKFIIWENVPGAFSSNKGEDFRCVLESICKIKNENFSIPGPPKWSSAGEIVGDNFSLAWRTLDAQYFGVPQRRKRIYLIADFGSKCAGKILFESEGMSGYSAESVQAWQRTSGSCANSIDHHDVYAMTTGNNMQIENEKSPTLTARDFKDPNTIAYGIGRDAFNQGKNAKWNHCFFKETQPTLVAKGPGAIQKGYIVRRFTPTECARLQGFPDSWCANLGTENPTDAEVKKWQKIFDDYNKAIGKTTKPKTEKQIRKWLQNPHSDSAEYKMWGNGVALPCVCYIFSLILLNI